MDATPHVLHLVAPPVTPTALPFISVIVPVRNEEAFLGSTLEELIGQDYPADRFEVLVADGRSTDHTRDIVAAFSNANPQVRLLDNPARLSSAGRNVAIRASRGDIVVVIDGHCELDNPHYLSDLADAFARSGADCVGRPQPLDVTQASRVQRAIAAARASRLGHHPSSHIWSGQEGFVPPQSVAVAYRREVFDRVGFFDESFDACEDVELNHRIAQAGLTCFFTPRVRVRYRPRTNLRGLFHQMVRYGRGRARLLRKHPGTFTPLGFAPAALLAGLVPGPLVCAWAPALWALWLAVVGAYLAAILIASLVVAWRQREVGLLPLLPLAFLCIHLGAGAGQWREVFARTSLFGRRPKGGATRIMSVAPPGGRRPNKDAPRQGPLNALTIDVEDYYHVSGFEHCVARESWDDFEPRVQIGTQKILEILEAAGVKATFFVLGWVAQRQPRLVRAIRAAGHEVGCHSYAHRLIYEQTPAQFREDLRRARATLEDALGELVLAYRAPSFSITARSLWALDVLAEEGFQIDSSIYPTRHDRYGLPGAPTEPHAIELAAGTLWEFPPPVWRLWGYPLPVGGGGYFRLYPYALTRRGLRRINATGKPFATYLHPWELDPDQPRLRPGRLTAFRHYVGLRRTEERLRRLLGDFRFGTLSAALASWGAEAATARRAA